MKKKYGYNGFCYWLIIESQEEADNYWQGKDKDYAKNSIANGDCLFINENGGFHCGDLSGMKDIHESEEFPTAESRLSFLLED